MSDPGRRRRARLGLRAPGILLAGLTIAAVAVTTAGAATLSKGGASRPAAAKHHAAVKSALTTLSTTIPNFTQSVHVNDTLEGCRNDGSITFPSSGPFICPDTAYTTGNLGKGWNELDLVPWRVTTTLGTQSTATTDYNLVVAGDHNEGGATGWDVISVPTVNSSSDSSCTVSVVQQSPNGGALSANNAIGPSLAGGATDSIYEVLSIHQDRGTTCVFDYYMRLALGSHLFSGSSLQGYLLETADFSGGQSNVSLPVNEIAPQSINKDSSASQDQSNTWNVTKTPTPATVNIPNTCSSKPSDLQAGVSVEVDYSIVSTDPTGPITVISHVYATNPSARTISVSVTDQTFSGTTLEKTTGPATATLLANTANNLVLTDTVVLPAGTTNINDKATATYTDTITGITVPGTTTATASVASISAGNTLNASAVVNDVEGLNGSGAGWTFSTDSFSGTTGAFDNSYVAGTATTGPVSWTSDPVTAGGSVTFAKTVYVAAGTSSSNNLHDEATITGSDGSTASATGDVTLSAHRLATLTITKTIPAGILTGNESVTFNFTVTDTDTNTTAATPSVTFAAGDPTSKNIVLTNLAPDHYKIHETAPTGTTSTGWTLAPDATSNLTAACSDTQEMDNTFAPATAFANKVTDPTGNAGNWAFTIKDSGNNVVATGTTDSSGNVVWTGGASTVSIANEGTYTVSETAQNGWTEQSAAQASGSSGTVTGGTGVGATCSFTVNYPADAGKTFGCTITNQSRGQITVIKNTVPAGSSQSFGFTTTGTGYNGFNLTGVTTGNANQNVQTVATPGTYTVTEGAVSGWSNTGLTCTPDTNGNPAGGGTLTTDLANRKATLTLSPGEHVTCTYTNTQLATLIVKKVTVPAGSSQLFTFDPTGFNSGTSFQLSGVTTGNANQRSFTNLTPGSGYAVGEESTTGWDLTSATCDGTNNTPLSITLPAGGTVTCTFTNTQRGSITIKKVTDPAGGSGFTFTGDVAGTLNDQGTKTASNLVPGTYSSVEGAATGWTLQSVTCDDSSSATVSSGNTTTRTATFKLDPGEHVTCTFTNKSRAHVKVTKTVSGLPLTSGQSFTFQLREGATPTQAGTIDETQIVTSLNNPATFSTDLIPGNTYQVCEIVMPGWNTTLGTFVPNAFVPPDGVALNPSVDNSILCVNITPTYGQLVSIPVDNTPPPGGRALTIGFWKSWASCAVNSGKQKNKAVLDATLYTASQDAAGGLVVSAGNLGSGWPSFASPYYLILHGGSTATSQSPDCLAAVNLLNKSTASKATKMANDPLFNMTAQLIAAELNYFAGAGKTGITTNNIASAVLLDGKYHFNGNTYNTSLSSADTTFANCLANQLNQYNNDLTATQCSP